MSNYRDNLERGQRAQREQDFKERNFVLNAISFEAEHTIQIRCGAAVLCTVSEPAGPGGAPTVFHVYKENLNYREETDYDDEANIVQKVWVSSCGGDVEATYRVAVQYAYSYAIGRVALELNVTEEA